MGIPGEHANSVAEGRRVPHRQARSAISSQASPKRMKSRGAPPVRVAGILESTCLMLGFPGESGRLSSDAYDGGTIKKPDERDAMKAALVVGVLLGLAYPGSATAQNWDATTHLTPGSSKSCPKANATFAFDLAGAELSVRTPAGHTYRGAVAPEGTFEIQYDSTSSAIGRLTISGNALTRDIVLSSPARRECIYALTASVPTEPNSAYVGSVGDWALGRWNGLQVRNVQGVGIQASPYSLIIERNRNGKVLCRFGDPEAVTIVLWAPQCNITSDSAGITAGDSQMSLNRVDAHRLEGTMRYPGGSATIRFSR